MQDQQAVLDFEFVAIGRLAVVAKQIMEVHYGKARSDSYYVGCSTGGREAMLMSQRYPLLFRRYCCRRSRDANGLFQFGHALRCRGAECNRTERRERPASRRRHLSDSDKKAVIAKLLEVCDARDGAADGMIFNVTGCSFRPADLQCAGAKAEGCLSAEQVAAIKKVSRARRLRAVNRSTPVSSTTPESRRKAASRVFSQSGPEPGGRSHRGYEAGCGCRSRGGGQQSHGAHRR